jgi:hypothetical protein
MSIFFEICQCIFGSAKLRETLNFLYNETYDNYWLSRFMMALGGDYKDHVFIFIEYLNFYETVATGELIE